ncbi:MAG: PAS domain-containing sensor histidine kinase [Bacteroidales bacterium]|nr:PAS domain-containing sensor histidine kinase [Bacteroidales bacterium]
MDTETNFLTERIKELERENSILREQQVEINKAKELYLKIFEEFPALIWRSRLDKLCDYFNKTWLEFTGRTMEQEFGNGWAEGVHPDDFDFCLRTYVTAFDKKEAFLMEYRMKNKFGEYRWIRDFGRPFHDLDNSFIGYIGSCYDITENKNNELRLIELNATKDKFFSIIAHDLKTPFNSIIGFSEHLIEEVKEKNYDKIVEVARIILQSSNRAMDLLANLMTWSQLESGRMPFNPEHFDIANIISEVTSLLKVVAEQKHIHVENKISPNTQVFADKEMVSTVLRNLISNAMKFTQTGGIIKFSSVNEKNELIVTITDNGVGISKERIDKLFTISESSSTLGTQKEKGTGLGLILCKEFIEKNKGEIWIESSLGDGSTFNFSLPTVNENM